MLDHTRLRRLDEGDLRDRMLVPLFRAMGFRDVALHHGSDELGKDLVMWKTGEVGERINYVVVAKARKVSGKATGTTAASNVCTQVRQALGSSYRDPVTNEERRAHRCFVVSSKEITMAAQKAISAELSDDIARVVTYIAGDKLLSLVQKHLPRALLLGSLKTAQEGLRGFPEGVDVRAETTKDATRLSITARDGVVGDEALKVHASFSFPDTPEGRAAKDALDAVRRRGGSAVIGREYLRDLQIPSFLKDLLPDGVPEGFALESRPPDATFLMSVEVEDVDGVVERIPYIDMRAVSGGTEEVVLSNGHQPIPWTYTLTMNWETGLLKLDCDTVLEGATAKLHMDVYRLNAALAKGGSVRLTHLDTGLQFAEMSVQPGAVEAPDDAWVDAISRLLSIQMRLVTPIPIPERDISMQEISEVLELAQLLDYGEATLSGLILGVAESEIDTFLEKVRRGEQVTVAMQKSVFHVLDTPVQLGPQISVLSDVEVVLTERELSVPPGYVHVKLRAKSASGIYARFPQWLPSEDAKTDE